MSARPPSVGAVGVLGSPEGVCVVDSYQWERDQYAVVLNDLDVDVGEGFALGGGWILARPTDDQIDQFRPFLTNLTNATNNFRHKSAVPPQEYQVTEVGEALMAEPIGSPTEWRYLIVRRTDTSTLAANALVQALLLSDAEIFADYWPNGEPPRADLAQPRVRNNAAVTTFFNEHYPSLDQPVPAKPNLDEIREVAGLRAALDDAEFPEIARLLDQFVDTFTLSIHSPQSALACLGIIEGLLTHNPAPGDPVDSISRQLQRNLMLLDHRLPPHRKLELTSFRNTTPKKVITHLYSYRSAVAHGGQADKELHFFSDQRWRDTPALAQKELHCFTRRVLKRLLIASLAEPQLVSDLKGAG